MATVNPKAVTTFVLASKYKTGTHVGSYLFQPGIIYNETNYPISNSAISNAFATGILTFTDATSLTEVQSNPVVAASSLQDYNSTGGTRAQGSVATTPVLKLASSVKSPMTIGPWQFVPGKVYQDKNIFMNDLEIVSALARGFLIFADGTNVNTVLADPLVYQLVVAGHAKIGYFGAHNVYGV